MATSSSAVSTAVSRRRRSSTGQKRAWSPTGETPNKEAKKPLQPKSLNKPSRSKKTLSFESETELRSLLSTDPPDSSSALPLSKYKWSIFEDETLIRFILLTSLGKEWPSEKNSKLWESASKFLGDVCKTNRSSKAFMFLINLIIV